MINYNKNFILKLNYKKMIFLLLIILVSIKVENFAF